MNQLDLFQSRVNRDIGIKKAEDHANSVHESWSDKAYEFLRQYIRHDAEFMTEQIREASEGIVPEPPSKRAWGSIVLKAARAGLIKKIGYKSVSNPKANATPATLWRVV